MPYGSHADFSFGQPQLGTIQGSESEKKKKKKAIPALLIWHSEKLAQEPAQTEILKLKSTNLK